LSAKKPDPLRLRIAEAKKLLAAQLEKNEGGAEVEKLVRHLGLLEGLARARRRRRSALWAVGAVAAALITATVLRFWLLDQVDMALVAETRAFVFLNGEATRNILPMSVLLREVTAAGQSIARCTDPERIRPFACKPAATLRLNTVFVHAKTTAAVRQIGSCFEVVVFEGGASADVSALLPADKGQAPAEAPRWMIETLDLHPGESFSFCPVEGATLHCSGITSAMVGDRIGGGRSEQEDTPALSKASLSILTTSESATFLGTDIPHLGDLSNGVAVAWLGDPMELSLVGKAKRLTVETGSHRRNLMPSRLDWVRGKPAFKAALTLLAAIFGAVVAVRERWLGELG
jgi:hypothetical protein